MGSTEVEGVGVEGVRGARPLLTACVLLLAAALLAAATRPTTADESAAIVETTPTTPPPTSTTLAPSTTAVAAPADTTSPPATAAPRPRAVEGPASTTTTTEAPTTTTTKAPVSSGRCGPLPKKGGGTWQCTLSEEFDGTALNDRIWTVQTTEKSGYHIGIECFVDDPDNVSVAGGTLKLTVRAERGPFRCPKPRTPYETHWTSGMVMTYGKWAQAYGRFEIRAKLPAAKVYGLQTSLWMWPVEPYRNGPWPGSGEIDIAEWFSDRPEYVIPYIHYLGGEAQGATEWYCKVGAVEQWHTYALEWTSTTLTILYDGVPCLSISPAIHPFNQPFTIALTQALGIKKNDFEPGITPLPATTEVDYVRVWK